MPQFESISDDIKTFILNQKMFFVSTAAPDGRINLSPKGLDSLRIDGPNRVLWLNLTGSGNETAAHLLESDRMTIMLCAFEGKPNILRLYGHARAVHPTDADWEELVGLFPKDVGARQVIDMHVEMMQTSCGTGVPFYDFVGDRGQLAKWSEKRGEGGVRDYWAKKNTVSIDGRDTGMGKVLNEEGG